MKKQLKKSKTKTEKVIHGTLYVTLFFIFTSIFFMILSLLIYHFSAENQTNNPFATSCASILDNTNKAAIRDTKKIPKPIIQYESKVDVNAEAYIILDKNTLTPLVEKNENQKLLLASITKLMTATVALENAKQADIVTIKNDFSDLPTEKLGLYVGEKISLENLIYASLIPSANDAASAIAYYIGKGDYNKFIKMMNDKALTLGMKNTHYTNAVGLDDENNYSSVTDLAYLANYVADIPLIANTVKLQEKQITDVSGKNTYDLKTTNELLGDRDLQILGFKTGQTPEALGCLLTLAKLKNNQEIIVVVLGSNDRFGETKKLVQWSEENFTWE